jgi:hypothetical protein
MQGKPGGDAGRGHLPATGHLASNPELGKSRSWDDVWVDVFIERGTKFKAFFPHHPFVVLKNAVSMRQYTLGPLIRRDIDRDIL